MKRLGLHVSFWLFYILEDQLLGVNWVAPALTSMPSDMLWWIVFQSVILSLIPKLFLAYYVMRVALPKLLSEKAVMVRAVIEVALVFAMAIVANRALTYYYVHPILYGGVLKNDNFLGLGSLIVEMIDIGFIAGLAIIIKVVRMQLKAKENEKILIKEKLETELKFLRNQTNPHFLLNTLNNIYALARKRSLQTADVVLRLSELLSFMLYESGTDQIPLTKEIKLLDSYLELETIRYNDRLSLSFSKNVDADSYQISPLLLLPFVENAFKHGVSESRFETFIDIELKVEKDVLQFCVENTNETEHHCEPSKSIGLANVRRQLELT
ncbi:MAG: sensor histidine kinase, partial [Mucilaginibacter sp.]